MSWLIWGRFFGLFASPLEKITGLLLSMGDLRALFDRA